MTLGSSPTDIQTELEKELATNGTMTSSNAVFTFEDGTGRNTISNATTTTKDSEKPKVIVTLKDSVKNFTGSFEAAPFSIAKSDQTLTADSNATTVTLEIPESAGLTNQEIDLGAIIKDEITDKDGNALYVKEELADVDFKDLSSDKADLLKFFSGVEDPDNTSQLIPNISIDKNTWKLTYSTRKSSAITTDDGNVTLRLTYKFNNYSTDVDVSIKFVATQDSTKTATIEKVNGDGLPVSGPVEVEYTGEKAKITLDIVDDTNADLTEGNNTWSVKATFYKKDGSTRTKLGNVVNVASDACTVDGTNKYKASIEITAPNVTVGEGETDNNYIEIGSYSVYVVFTNETKSTHIKQMIDFDIVKAVEKGTFVITSNDDSTAGRDYGTSGQLPLNKEGTLLSADDITVKIGDHTLEYGKEYTIRTPKTENTTAEWTYAKKLEELKVSYPALSVVADMYTNADVIAAEAFLKDGEGNVIKGINKETTENLTLDTAKIFKDQPYAIVELLSSNTHYESADPVYIRYEIKGGNAIVAPGFYDAGQNDKTYTVDIGDTGRTSANAISLTGAYVMNGKTVEPESYTVSASGGTITRLPSKITDGKLTYTSEALAAGNTITFTLTPKFADNSGVSTSADLTIKVKCVGSVTLANSVKASVTAFDKTTGTVEYNNTEIVPTSAIDYTAMHGTTDVKETITTSNFDTTIYQLLDEVTTFTGYDATTHKNMSYTYPKDGGKTYVCKTAGDGTTPITAKNAGHYIAVTSLKSTVTNYEAEDAVLPFEITKKVLDNTNACLNLVGTYNSTDKTYTVEYKGADNNWANKVKAKTNVVTDVCTKDTQTKILDIASSDYDVLVGDLTVETKNNTDTYKVPVSITCKTDSTNFTGTVTGEVLVSACTTQIDLSTITAEFNKKTLTYNGEKQNPGIRCYIYKNKSYAALGELEKAIDPDGNAKLTLVLPGEAGNNAGDNDGITAGTQTAKITVGGLYTGTGTLGGGTYTISPAQSDNISEIKPVTAFVSSSQTNAPVAVTTLPKTAESTDPSVAPFEITGYALNTAADGTSGVSADASGTTTSKKLKISFDGYTLKVEPDSSLAASDEGAIYKFKIKANIKNYESKVVDVTVTVKNNDLKVAATGFTAAPFYCSGDSTNTVAFNGRNAYERMVAVAEADRAYVTIGGMKKLVNESLPSGEGELKFEWYKSSTYAGTYTACSVEDTVNVGYYKAMVTLDDATNYYMTPFETGVIGVAKKTITASNISGEPVFKADNYVYNGEVQAPEAAITLKSGVLYTAGGGEAADSSEYEMTPENKAFTFTYANAGNADTTGTYAGTVTATVADGNFDVSGISPAITYTYKIAKKEVVISLSDATLPLKTTDTPAVTYDMVKGTVTGIVEDVDKLDEGKIVLKATDSDGKSVALADICKKAGKYTVEVDDEFAADTITNTAGGTDKTDNYKLDVKNSKAATITVAAAKVLTSPTIEVYADGNKVSKNGRVKYTGEDIAIDVIVKDGTDALKKAVDYTFTPVTVKEVGGYTIKISSAGDMYSFADQEFSFTVKDSSTPVPTEEVPEEDDPSETNESYLKPGEDTELGTLKDIEEGDYAISTSSILLNNKTDLTVTYNGSAYTPKVKIAGLKQNEDFKVVYSNNTNASTEENKAIVKIVGINDYSGIVEKAFTIAPKPVKSLTVTAGTVKANATNEYTTDDVCFGISDGNKKNLVEDMDYTIKDVKYDKNKKKVNVVIEGIGNYGGTKDNIYLALSKADKIAMTECDLVKIADDKVYTGKAVKLDQAGDIVITYTDEKDNEKTLEYNRDYKVTYKNNINAGMATAIIKGVAKQGYDGTIVAQFPINRYDFEDEDTYKQIDVKITTKLDKIVYNGKLQTPKVKVVDKSIGNGKTLGKKDYVVFYTGELNAGKGVGTVIVKGINSYAGYVWSQPFDINAQEMKKATVAKARGDKYITVKYNKKNLIPGEDFRIKVSGTSGKVDLTIEAIETVATVDGDLTGNFKNFVTKKVKFEDINPDWIE